MKKLPANNLQAVFEIVLFPFRLTLGELEALAGTGATWLLTFLHAGVTRQQAVFTQLGAVGFVDLYKRTGNGQTNGADLTLNTATGRYDLDVVLVHGACDQKWLKSAVLKLNRRKVFLEGALVDHDASRSFGKPCMGNCCFATACSVIRCLTHISLLVDVVNDGLLGRMRMFGTGIDLEFGHLGAAKAGVGHHALDGKFDEQLGTAGANLAGSFDLLSAEVAREAGVDLGILFVAGQNSLFSVDDDDVVTAINVRGENCFVLATQKVGSLNGYAAEHLIGGINNVPLAL